MEPLVSICCTAYNHEKYLAQTLESFLSQRCDFAYEILIHDDVSTDRTADIIREYAARYPHIIRPMFQTQNQYSRGVPINETFNFPRARGKYIALCEGDDYWCDPDKLQRQIAHMESDPGCTFCFTNGYVHDEAGVHPDRPFLPYYENEKSLFTGESRAFTLDEMARVNFIPTASFVFRVDALRALPPSFTQRECQHGDLRMRLFLTAAGHAWYEHLYACTYRENVSGSAMQIWKKEKRDLLYRRCQSVVDMVNDVDDYSRGAASAGLQTIRDHYLWVMAHNAPDLKTLVSGEVGRVWRTLPAKERLRCAVRLMLPTGLAARLGQMTSR
ncbi:MAG: glycosyltransferase [Clostridia bacterium]|nr:glycosyltransferase [Clostridia bacterium]